jgi:uncharacterized protein with FMN-binding domain
MRRTALAAATAASLLPLTAPAASLAATKSYVGTTAHMRWGDVTVRIWVSGHRITNLHATYPRERHRSAEINDRCGPVLRSEALRAQSANVHSVSGATMSSGAFKQSLRSALAKAHL